MEPEAVASLARFESVSVVLPVINEHDSLLETVRIIRETCDPKDIAEYLIVVCERTTLRARSACERVQAKLGDSCVLHEQVLPFIGGAMREAFDLARGSHVIMMSTDLETDPYLVKEFIAQAKRSPDSVVTASRWLVAESFHGYNPVKLVANRIFQKLFSLLYGTHLSDLTYAYRIFPTALVQDIDWEELKHPFFLETIIKPLRLGVPVLEVPAVWRSRTEGESQNSFFANFAYFGIALRVRWQSRASIRRKVHG